MSLSDCDDVVLLNISVSSSSLSFSHLGCILTLPKRKCDPCNLQMLCSINPQRPQLNPFNDWPGIDNGHCHRETTRINLSQSIRMKRKGVPPVELK